MKILFIFALSIFNSYAATNKIDCLKEISNFCDDACEQFDGAIASNLNEFKKVFPGSSLASLVCDYKLNPKDLKTKKKILAKKEELDSQECLKKYYLEIDKVNDLIDPYRLDQDQEVFAAKAMAALIMLSNNHEKINLIQDPKMINFLTKIFNDPKFQAKVNSILFNIKNKFPEDDDENADYTFLFHFIDNVQEHLMKFMDHPPQNESLLYQNLQIMVKRREKLKENSDDEALKGEFLESMTPEVLKFMLNLTRIQVVGDVDKEMSTLKNKLDILKANDPKKKANLTREDLAFMHFSQKMYLDNNFTAFSMGIKNSPELEKQIHLFKRTKEVLTNKDDSGEINKSENELLKNFQTAAEEELNQIMKINQYSNTKENYKKNKAELKQLKNEYKNKMRIELESSLNKLATYFNKSPEEIINLMLGKDKSLKKIKDDELKEIIKKLLIKKKIVHLLKKEENGKIDFDPFNQKQIIDQLKKNENFNHAYNSTREQFQQEFNDFFSDGFPENFFENKKLISQFLKKISKAQLNFNQQNVLCEIIGMKLKKFDSVDIEDEFEKDLFARIGVSRKEYEQNLEDLSDKNEELKDHFQAIKDKKKEIYDPEYIPNQWDNIDIEKRDKLAQLKEKSYAKTIQPYTFSDRQEGDILIEYEGNKRKLNYTRPDRKHSFLKFLFTGSHSTHAAVISKDTKNGEARKIEMNGSLGRNKLTLDSHFYTRQFRINYEKLVKDNLIKKSWKKWNQDHPENQISEKEFKQQFMQDFDGFIAEAKKKYLNINTKKTEDIEAKYGIQVKNSYENRKSSPFRNPFKRKGRKLGLMAEDIEKERKRDGEKDEMCSQFAGQQQILIVNFANSKLKEKYGDIDGSDYLKNPLFFGSKVNWSSYHTGRLVFDMWLLKKRGIVTEIKPNEALGIRTAY